MITPELKEKMIAVSNEWAQLDAATARGAPAATEPGAAAAVIDLTVAADELKEATLDATDKKATLTVNEELKNVYKPVGRRPPC